MLEKGLVGGVAELHEEGDVLCLVAVDVGRQLVHKAQEFIDDKEKRMDERKIERNEKRKKERNGRKMNFLPHSTLTYDKIL